MQFAQFCDIIIASPESLNDNRIKSALRPSLDRLLGSLRQPGRFVRTGRSERVKHVCHCHDARSQRDLLRSCDFTARLRSDNARADR